MTPTSTSAADAASELPRPTPTQAFRELAMAVAQRGTAPESSVTISRNAKGVAQFEVTVRGESVQGCLADALVVFGQIEAVHPYPATNGAGE